MGINKKITKKTWLKFSLAFILLIILGGIFFDNSMKIYYNSKLRTENYLFDVTHQTKRKVDELINNSIKTLNIVKEISKNVQDDAKEAYYQQICAETNFTTINEFKNSDEAQQWINETFGEEYQINKEKLLENKTDLISITYDSKVLYVMGNPDENVLVGLKENNKLKNLLNDSSFKEIGYSFPILENGIIVTEDSELNIFDVLKERYRFDKIEIKTFNQGIQEKQRGFVEAKNEDGEVIFINYEPLNYASWTLVTVVPAEALGVSIENNAMLNLLLTFFAILIFLGLFVSLWYLQRAHLKKIQDYAFKDSITKGMNKNYFLMESKSVLTDFRKNENYYLISLDIKDFKVINSVYGINEGNKTLKYIYEKILSYLYDDEIVTRDVADTFIILLHAVDDKQLESRLDSIYQAMKKTTQEKNASFFLEIRCGIYKIFSPDDIEKAIECANFARKNQKDNNDNFYSYYNHEILSKRLKEKELLSDFKVSLKNGDFKVYLQPKVDLITGLIVGGEALVRWIHPQKGFMLPGEYISVFEENNVISQLDKYVFEEVCKMLSRWQKDGRELCRISINLSKYNLSIPNFLEQYYQICQKYNVLSKYIEFELTETVFISDSKQIQVIIDRMHHLGFSCSLDDFGTGYSSLSLLKELNIDTLKLDRSFFIGKNNNDKGMAIVETILNLASKFNMETVVEGIDNDEQLKKVKNLGANIVQGFIFYQPMPISEFETEISKNKELNSDYLSSYSFDQQKIIENNDDITTLIYNLKTKNVSFSSNLINKLNISSNHLLFDDLIDKYQFVYPNDKNDFTNMIKKAIEANTWQISEIRVRHDEYRYKWMNTYIRYDKEANIIVIVFINYSLMKHSLALWKEKANRDPLTQLYNREYFEASLKDILKNQSIKRGALIFVDIDNFKMINDTYGHSVGDSILCYATQKMQHFFREDDILVRYAGDEFVIFMPNVTIDVLEKRLHNINVVYHEPYQDGQIKISVSCSIGAAYFENCYPDFTSLLNCADEAMYKAKANGKNQYFIQKYK